MLVPSLNTKAIGLLEKHLSGESMDYRRVLAILVPVLVDQAFVTCLNLFNTAMISSAGVAAVSAVSMVDSLNFFLVSVFIAVSTGGTVVVAQFKGSGNEGQVGKAAAGSIASVVLLSVGIGAAVIAFHGPLLGFLFGKADPQVLSGARVYLIGSCASYAGIAAEEGVCGALRGVGDTRSTLVLSFIMNLSYVLLNFLTIDLLHMGILGMSLSIVAARYLAAACALLYLSKWDNPVHFRFRDLFRFNPSMLGKIFFIGVPFAAEQMFFNGGKILTQTFIVGMGTLSMDANAICGSLSAVFLVPGNAFIITLVTVVGQCIGNRNVADARRFIRSFLLLASASTAALAALILPFFHPLVALFHPPGQVVGTVLAILLVNSAAQVLLWPVSFMAPSALRAGGDAKFTSAVSMLSMWLFRVVLGYVLGVALHLGIFGVWLAMDLEWGVRGLVFLRRCRGDKWYRHNLIDT